MRADAQTRTIGLEVALCVLAGVTWMLVCEHKLAPALLIEGSTTASDVGEHFWMLHALSEPGWSNFSINRYPLPSVIARGVCFADAPFGCWRIAAFVSMGVMGAAMYGWARAVAGRAAGVAAVLMAAGFAELVLNARTVTAYPVILALWTSGAALSALALWRPSVLTVLLGSIGAGLVFASDARGLLVGVPILGVLAVASLRAGWRSVPGAVLPLVVSWSICGAIPVKPRPLEALVEATVEMSFTRNGQAPPERQQWGNNGWIWGHSTPADVVGTVRYLREARARMYTDDGPYSKQANNVRLRLTPLYVPVLWVLLGLVPVVLRAPVRALGLLPVLPLLAMLYNAATLEYYERYASLGMSATAVLCGVALTGWTGLLFRRWLAVVVAWILLTAAPTPFHLHASWRRPFTAQQDLQRCLTGTVDPKVAVDECVRSALTPMAPMVWPF